MQEAFHLQIVGQRKIKTEVESKLKKLTLQVKKKQIIIPHEKRHGLRLQTQAIGDLATCVNKMAELQVKPLKLQDKKRERTKKGNRKFS